MGITKVRNKNWSCKAKEISFSKYIHGLRKNNLSKIYPQSGKAKDELTYKSHYFIKIVSFYSYSPGWEVKIAVFQHLHGSSGTSTFKYTDTKTNYYTVSTSYW